MRATEDISKHDLIAYIPREFLITNVETSKSLILKQLKKKGQEAAFDTQFIQMQLYVMEERKHNMSAHRDYFLTLPTDWSNFPSFYTDEEHASLNGSAFQYYSDWET